MYSILKKNGENKLFLGLVLILVPILLTASLPIRPIIYTVGIMMAYTIQTLLLLYTFKSEIVKIRKHKVAFILLGLFIVSQLIVLIFCNATNKVEDFANIVILMLNGIVIIGASGYGMTVDQTRKFMIFFVQLSLAACIYNVVINYNIIAKVILGLNTEYVQIASFFPNRNTFGFLLVCACYAIILLMNIDFKKWYIVVLLFFIFNLFLTMSRTSIFATFIIIIVELCYLVFYKKVKLKDIKCKLKINVVFFKKYIVIISTLVILFVASFCSIFVLFDNEKGDTVYSQIARVEDISNASGRTELWMEGISIWKDSPIFGVGKFQAVSYLEQSGIELNQFHNAFIEALASHGIFGLGLFLTLFIWVFLKIIKSGVNTNIKATLIAFYLSIGFQSLLETRVRFSCGFVDTFTVIFIVLVPLLLVNGYDNKSKFVK